MEPNINVTIRGIDENLANSIGHVMGDAVATLEDFEVKIDLRRMYRIVVTTDFAGELSNMSGNVTSGEFQTHTDEEYAVGVAQVRVLPLDGNFEFVPVIDAQIAANLVQDNEEGYKSDEFKTSLHLLHHELCHVHDYNKKLDAIEIVHPDNAKDGFLLSPSNYAWSEYIANYLSCATVTKNSIEMTSENLIGAIERTKDEINNEICNYRIHGDLDCLVGLFRRHGHFLIKSAAYMLGYIDGLGKPHKGLDIKSYEVLTGSYFEKTWNEMHDALRAMKEAYPHHWKDIGIYDQLNGVMESYYFDMGMILSSTSDGQLYIEIPFRPGNTPGG